jgi:hypothetical protein
MKGYLVTPVVFLALFLIVGAFALFASRMDQQGADSVMQEARVKKLLVDEEKRFLQAGPAATAALADNNEENTLPGMSVKVAGAIKSSLGLDANVTLSDNGDNRTKMSVTLTSLKPSASGVSADYSAYQRTTVLPHPFYAFYLICNSFNPKEVCSYVTWSDTGGCDTSFEGSYESAKRKATGFLWDLTFDATKSACDTKKLYYTVSIQDPENAYSIAKPFRLKDKSTDSKDFDVQC